MSNELDWLLALSEARTDAYNRDLANSDEWDFYFEWAKELQEKYFGFEKE